MNCRSLPLGLPSLRRPVPAVIAGGWELHRALPWLFGGYVFCATPASGAHGQLPDRPVSEPRSVVRGTARDEARRPLPDALVSLYGSNVYSTTDSAGHFEIAGLGRGTFAFRVRKLGYQPHEFSVTLHGDSVVLVAVELASVQVLNPVDVKAARVSERFERTGFPFREQLGIGRFVSPQRVESLRKHAWVASQLLREVPGLEVSCSTATVCSVRPRLPPYCLHLFVNGALRRGALDDWVTVSDVYAIEVYDRPSRVPAEFGGPLPPKSQRFTVRAGCGALAVWTRSRIER